MTVSFLKSSEDSIWNCNREKNSRTSLKGKEDLNNSLKDIPDKEAILDLKILKDLAHKVVFDHRTPTLNKDKVNHHKVTLNLKAVLLEEVHHHRVNNPNPEEVVLPEVLVLPELVLLRAAICLETHWPVEVETELARIHKIEACTKKTQ